MRVYGSFECCERSFLPARFKTVMAILRALDINAKWFIEHGKEWSYER